MLLPETDTQGAAVLADKLRVPERAIDVYERVLEAQPENREALDALAGLRAAETLRSEGYEGTLTAAVKRLDDPEVAQFLYKSEC